MIIYDTCTPLQYTFMVIKSQIVITVMFQLLPFIIIIIIMVGKPMTTLSGLCGWQTYDNTVGPVWLANL
jgi:hypothetical protein